MEELEYTWNGYYKRRYLSKRELEELEYFASNVNVANFVSVKLSGHSNYHIWKAQMLSLLDKLKICDIVENRERWFKYMSEDVAKRYDILLKGWIMGSLSEELRRHFDSSACGHCVWVTLEEYMAKSSNVYVSASKKELEEYMHASNVNVSNFVSVKLCGPTNYHIWKAQMLALLDKLMIPDIVENPYHWSKSKSKYITERYNILLKGWILGSLSEEALRHLDYSADAQSIWVTLADEYCFSGYPTVKLSGRSNYHIWKTQMISLMDELMIRDIVENHDYFLKSKGEDLYKYYDILLKGCILGSLSEEVLGHLDYSANSQSIWMRLEDEYCFRGYISNRYNSITHHLFLVFNTYFC